MARPNLSYLKNLILFLLGIPLGLVAGLTAMAASVFAVPLVRPLLGLKAGRAAGVGLAATFFAALASLLSYALAGRVWWGLALVLTVAQVIGAAWGERLALRFPALDRLPWLWGTLVVLGGLAMAAQALGLLGGPVSLPHTAARPLWIYPLALLVGFLVGVVSRVVSLGGVLLVPAAIYALGLPPQAAQGTALVVLALAALPGMLLRARRGDVEPQGATWLSAGAVLGGLGGALFAVGRTMTEVHTLLVFGVVLTLIGLFMLWRPAPVPEAEQQKAE